MPVIRGSVRDDGGRPVPHARAYFVSGPGPYPDVAAVADADGEFALGAPFGGTYEIGCSADGFASRVVAVDAGEAEEVGVEIRLAATDPG